MRIRLVPLALAATALVAVACKDSTGPAPITGTFLLNTIGGQALPVLVKEERSTWPGTTFQGTRREYVEGMRLVLPTSAADTFAFVKRIEWDLDTADDPAPAYEYAAATNVVRGDTLCYRFGTFDEPSGACPPAQVIRRSGAGIALMLPPGPSPSGRSEYVFVRER